MKLDPPYRWLHVEKSKTAGEPREYRIQSSQWWGGVETQEDASNGEVEYHHWFYPRLRSFVQLAQI
jgi:hypothetical protein